MENQTNKNNLIVCVGVKDVRFGERKYRAVTSYKHLRPEEIPENERVGGYHLPTGSATDSPTIDDLAHYGLSLRFEASGITSTSEIAEFPFYNFGSAYFGEPYRPFDEEELQHLRERLTFHLGQSPSS